MKLKNSYVRWMGAFRKGTSLEEAIDFEMSATTEAAAEPVLSGWGQIQQSKIGLLIDPFYITKKFFGDCASLPDPDHQGFLFKTRNPRWSKSHKEIWIKRVPGKTYTGIIIKGRICNLKVSFRKIIEDTAKKYDLEIIEINYKGEIM